MKKWILGLAMVGVITLGVASSAHAGHRGGWGRGCDRGGWDAYGYSGYRCAPPPPVAYYQPVPVYAYAHPYPVYYNRPVPCYRPVPPVISFAFSF